MKKFLKSLLLWTAVAVLCVFALALLALSTDKQVSGLEEYSPADCSLSLSAYLFPCEDFPEKFSYLAGDYQYFYDGRISGSNAVALSYLKYAPEMYEEAKTFCLQQFSATDEHRFVLKGYTFIEHLWRTKKNAQEKWVTTCGFPDHFSMFAYNDESRVLLFLGYYNGETGSPLPEEDFEAFYNTWFARYYALEE